MFTRNQLKKLTPHVQRELALARESRDTPSVEFHHLEQAHVLGQYSTFWHVLVHLKMGAWALQHRRVKELLGQVMRVIGALTKTPLGLLPRGNTGGANISAFKRLPWSEEHEAIFQAIRNET